MAMIDKCYVDNYNDYKAFCDWAKDRFFITPRGVKIYISDYIFYWEEAVFKNEKDVPIFNTLVIVDNYLYHNCDLPFIKEWLVDRYNDENGLFKGLSDEITQVPVLPEIVPCRHVSVLKKGISRYPYRFFNTRRHKKHGGWLVDVESKEGLFWYNEDYDFWKTPKELDVITCFSAYFINKSIRSIIRKIIKKWKLPIDCKVTVWDRTTEWILLTK